MIQQTSIESYHEINLGKKQEIIYDAFDDTPLSNNDIARKIGWSINTVTPRVYELRSMGLLECAGSKVDWLTGKRNLVWKKKS